MMLADWLRGGCPCISQRQVSDYSLTDEGALQSLARVEPLFEPVVTYRGKGTVFDTQRAAIVVGKRHRAFGVVDE